jgi:leucyl aminopeptidase
VASASGPLTHGTNVTVTATVWAWNTGSSDSLDLYYAANANSPTWVLIGTIVPSAGGAQTISRTYTLPTGTLQAVRANFRYLGSASSCSTGAYDDHDDLVFAVN